MGAPLDPVSAELIAARFRALGDPTRLLMLDPICGATARRRVGELAAQAGASQQNAPKHLAVLRFARIVSRRKQETSSLYRIADSSVHWPCKCVRPDANHGGRG